ncbi:MAG: tetratricopeptide repeat protein [Gammaproteobacteria bacterium]|nr:tetratricopeptide repeat protein [Gammaproteobacteria bacterium]
MSKLIQELRRREVFRTAGLYVGVAWILIEAASIFLPAFEAPDWVLRALIVAAVAGLPIAIVLAWVYDVTDKGVEVQADPTDTVIIPFGGRRMDFIVIGLLSVALIFSVYLNVSDDEVVDPTSISPISVLIADFDNQTGDQLFDGTLEQALQIGIESAPFIAGYRRDSAKRLAGSMDAANTVLDEATARLVAVREGVKLVMAGSIEEEGGKYTLYVRAIDPKGGEVLTSAEVDAKDKLDILAAIGTLSGDLREELGDKDLDRNKLITSETFTAKNLEAAQAYARAQTLQYNGKYDEATVFYEQALEYDPGFGRAYSGLALSAHALGRTEEADELWKQALTTLGTMTERERLRTLGLYYSLVTRNFQKAIETYELLVDKYPADDTAHNGLAVQYFYTLDFQSALREGAELLDIYPGSVMGRSNFALYAMYASDFATAVDEAAIVREQDPAYFKAWLPVAIAALANGDIEAAREAYRNMAPAGVRGELTGQLGLADAAMFAGDFDAAIDLFTKGIELAESAGSQYFLATMRIGLAQALHQGGGRKADAIEAVREALDASGGLPREVPAALIYMETGEIEAAAEIAQELGSSLQAQSRAYGALIDGLLALHAGDSVRAIESITAGVNLADLWLLRFYRGVAYIEAGFAAEALDDFTTCHERQGEASAVFLDDLPTWRYMAELSYWQGRSQLELGMLHEARQSLTAFLSRRPDGDSLAEDARQRMP